jgi:hypothetical protein
MNKPNQNQNISRLRPAVRLMALPLLLTGISTLAQTDTNLPANIDQVYLQNLVKRLNNDEAQIQNLKSEIALKNGNTPDNTAPAMPAAPTYPNLQFHGFADVDYHVSSRQGIPNAQGVTYNPPAARAGNSFYLGELDLFFQSQLAENLSVLSENVVSGGTDNHTGVDIERLELSWKINDYFNVDMGRFHTQLGYYNTAYHHGAWFQNAVGRPFFLEYEDSGGLLPVHSVGISMHGAIPSGKWNLQYFVEVANGEDYNTNANNPVQNEIDRNTGKALNFALLAKPDWFSGGQFGIGAYHDSLSPNYGGRTDEWIWNAHVAYHNALWELMAEGFLLQHKQSGTEAHYTPMAYAQVARKFGSYTPYVRFTYVNASQNDPIYTAILNQGGLDYGPSIGLRYDLSTFVALKLQYDYVVQTGYKDANEVTFQAAFTF